jgi:hypothetical protein
MDRLKTKPKGAVDEFAFILLAGLLFIFILVFIWSGSSGPVPYIEPQSLQLTLGRGAAYSYYLTINGTSKGTLSNVTLTSTGEVGSWITFDKNNFDITDSEKVRITINVPRYATFKNYQGSIIVKSKGGEDTLSLNINVVDISNVPLNSRPIYLGDISVRYSIGSETIASKENVEISKGEFGSSSETIYISVPPEKLPIITNGYVELEIEKTNRGGNLIVTFNGQKVFDEVTGQGNVTIPIEKSLINTTNKIEIRTTSPWWKFWSKTFYNIKSFNFVVRYVDILEREKTFDLDKTEILNFNHFQLLGTVKQYSSLQELKIKINNQLVYSDIPPIVTINQTLEKDLFGNNLYLKTANNTISFSFDREAFYQLEDTFLYIYYY